MACRHVQSMVQSVSKCSGNEIPHSPFLDTSLDSPLSLNKSSPHSKRSSQFDCLKCEGDVINPTKNVLTNNANQITCDFRCNEINHQIVNKCNQTKNGSIDDSDIRHFPNEYLWQKLELLIDHMVTEEDGIPVRNVKSLMSTIPSTFTGGDIVQWLMKHVGASDVAEAVYLASRIASMGYIFCIDDHVLTVKNDNHTYYRFQTPFLYPSRCMETDNVDYAVYLCKRTMQNKQRLELTGFEAERLASLQNMYCHKWEFIYIQAEAEAKVDKKRDKLERLVLESQERAYWDLHRPPPGCINTTDIDMRKLCRAKRPKKIPLRSINFPIPSGPDGYLLFSVLDNLSPKDCVTKLQVCARMRIKTSKAAESLQNFADQYSEFDWLISTSVGLNVTGNATNLLGQANLSGQLAHPTSNPILRIGSGDKPGHQPSRTVSTSGFNGIMPLSSNVLSRSGSGGVHNCVIGSGSVPLNSGMQQGLGNIVSGSATLSNPAYDQNTESVNTSNPWISDNPEYWNTDCRPKYLPIRRIKRWSFSIHELLKDPVGLEEFQRWLEKEFSAENLRFWQACQDLKGAPLKEVGQYIIDIYQQYLAPNAVEPLNVDSRVADSVRRQLETYSTNRTQTPTRYCFEEAEEHIFYLMKSDSYCRFLRSDVYRELFRGDKKKSKKHRSTSAMAVVVMASSSGNVLTPAANTGPVNIVSSLAKVE